MPGYSTIKNWNDGYNNYKNHSIIQLPNNLYYYKLTLKEENLTCDSWLETINQYLYEINTIDVLYSGGIDSEFALLTCKKLNKEVNAITMKIINKNVVYNEYELDYSYKFCRTHNIKQKIIDFDIKKFYENGDYVKYIEPYKISKANIASQFWLITQCDNFPIMGGNYFWIKENNLQQRCLSPMSYGSLFHDLYMKDNNIKGIGNLLNYGYNGLYLLLNAHLNFYKRDIDLGKLKQSIYTTLLNENLEYRQPKNGFEGYNGKHLHLPFANVESITWGNHICELLNTNIVSNGIR